MQSNSLPFSLIPLALFNGVELSEGGFELSRYLFLGSLLFSSPGGGAGDMDLTKVGEKILSSVRSARSLGLLPAPPSDRPEVPAQAAAAAAAARVLAGLPPHQRHNISSSSEELSSIYGSISPSQMLDDLEEEFYDEDFDPVRHVLEHIPTDDNELVYFEEKAAFRLAQLDRIAERLSRHVMEHHEVMVKGMNLVRELERDLKVANVICMNGRRHLTSSSNEISRDLIVHRNSKKKQALLDMLPILTELRHALDMQATLETLVEEGNFSKAFQVLSEYLQILDSLSQLSAVQEMSHGVEVWLGKTLQKLDALLLGVCRNFEKESYIIVVDAYALIGDVSGLAEKIQSFFMQEVISETHSVLKTIVQKDFESTNEQGERLTYSDLCIQMPESKFRQCLLATLAVLFKIMCSYHAILSFQPDGVSTCQALAMHDMQGDGLFREPIGRSHVPSSTEETAAVSVTLTDDTAAYCPSSMDNGEEVRDGGKTASISGSPWFQLRKDATSFVSQILLRGRRNLWQLATSRTSVLLSSPAVCSTSIHQFLTMYEDLNLFILAGEAFCGSDAIEFRQKVKLCNPRTTRRLINSSTPCTSPCAQIQTALHLALKLVLERENWLILPPEVTQVVSFAGLVGDGAALIALSRNSPRSRLGNLHSSIELIQSDSKRSGFSKWSENENPFLMKLNCSSKEYTDSCFTGSPPSRDVRGSHGSSYNKCSIQENHDESPTNGNASPSEDENDDLHADFIDEDSQLPSRISKPSHSRHHSSLSNDDEITAHTGSSLTLLRLLDKYARLMQKLEFVNVEFFKGIFQLFGIFFNFVFECFVNQSTLPSGKISTDMLSQRLKTALSRITQECDQWMKPHSAPFNSSSPTTLNTPFAHMDVTPTSPPSLLAGTSFSLKERCAGADTISLVARLLHRSKAHLQSILLKNNPATVEDFYVHLVDAVPDLIEHIHRTTARLFLHINGYVDRIANAKWELKDLGLEHNGYVDLLLGEFKHYKTRLVTGEIQKEVQDLLLEYGLDIVAETLVEGLSRVRRCTDEGRALMSLDLQVLINGLKHFVSIDVRPKLQIVETYIKAYYLPETEFVHWSRAHPEYTKGQVVGLVNLVATMKGWKRKTRYEVLEKIE